jgi:ribosomal protein S2
MIKNKYLIKFTYKQLINFNVHMGVKTNYWSPLNYDLVLGTRQDFFFLNLNLSILNLKNSFNLILFLLKNRYKILFYNYNHILTSLLFKNFNLYKLLKMNFGIGNWVSGYLTNFKLFRRQIKKFIKIYKKYLSIKSYKLFLKFNFQHIWNFFLFLRQLKILPSAIFLLHPNNFAILESLKLNIFSMALSDVNKNDSIYLSLHYLIPFNYLNFYSLSFLLNNLRYLIVLDNLSKKKLFFLLIIHFLKKQLSINKIKVAVVYSSILNLFNLKNKNLLKNLKTFSILNLKRLI